MLSAVETTARANPPWTERRAGKRHRIVLRTAKLRCSSGGEYPCVIHDVSETGTKLRLFHGHPPDSHMFLELANGEMFGVARRWADGIYAGFRFSCRIEVDDFLREKSQWRRRPVRLRTAHPVAIARSGEAIGAVLTNLSQQGACVETEDRIPLRSAIRLTIPGREPRLAHICWRRRMRHGLVFQEALSLEELAQLALQLHPYDGAALETAAPAPRANVVNG